MATTVPWHTYPLELHDASDAAAYARPPVPPALPPPTLGAEASCCPCPAPHAEHSAECAETSALSVLPSPSSALPTWAPVLGSLAQPSALTPTYPPARTSRPPPPTYRPVSPGESSTLATGFAQPCSTTHHTPPSSRSSMLKHPVHASQIEQAQPPEVAESAEPTLQPARRGRPPKPGSRGSKRRARLAAQAAQEAAAAVVQADKQRADSEAVRALEAIVPQSSPRDSFAGCFPHLPDIDPGSTVGEVLGQLAHTAQSAARFLHLNAPSVGEVSAAMASQAAEATLNAELTPRGKPGRKPLNDVPSTKRTAQNRASQRAFRERRQAHLQSLEAKVERYEQERTQMAEALTFLATMVARQQPRCVALGREAARLRELERETEHAHAGSRPQTDALDPPRPQLNLRATGRDPPPEPGPQSDQRSSGEGAWMPATAEATTPMDMDDRELPPLRRTSMSLSHLAPLPSLSGLSNWGRTSHGGSQAGGEHTGGRPGSQSGVGAWDIGDIFDDLLLLDGEAGWPRAESDYSTRRWDHEHERERERERAGTGDSRRSGKGASRSGAPLLPLRRRRRSSPSRAGAGKKPKLWSVSERRPMLGAWGSAPLPRRSCETPRAPGVHSTHSGSASAAGAGCAGGSCPPDSGPGSGPGSGQDAVGRAASGASGSVVLGATAASLGSGSTESGSGSQSVRSVQLSSPEPSWGV